MKKRIIFVGLGNLARETYHILKKDAGPLISQIDIAYYAEAGHMTCETATRDKTVLSDFDKLVKGYPPGQWHALICIGIPKHRGRLYDIFTDAGYQFETIISKESTIEPSHIGAGTIIFPGARVAVGARLEKNVLVNYNTVVGHDTIIGPHSVLSPGVNLGGRITGGSRVLYGIGSSVIENRSIGHDAVIAAGSSAWTDVASNTTVIGVPAISKKIPGKI